MTEINNRIIWLDIETTGSNPTSSDLLEIGIITTDNYLREIARGSWVVHWDKPFAGIDPVVVKMHSNNDLWYECSQVPTFMNQTWVQAAVIDWLNDTGLDTVKTRGNKIPVGGSGVGHFDLNFLKVKMPELSKSFTYWCYDVGVMRRMLRLAGKDHLIPTTNDQKNHRALDDTELHLKEAQFYYGLLKGLSSV